MQRDVLIRRIRELEPGIRAEGVRHLALFGSRARGDQRPDSDIDLLLDVDDASPFSILNLVGVEQIVSDAIGLPANAFMRRSLDEDFRASIAPHVVELF